MKKLLALALLALSLPALGNGVKHIQYGVPAKIPFTLYDSDGLFDATQADGGTEVTLYCDEDAGTTATNDFVRTDNTYSIVLTAAETQCARIMINVAADQLEIVPVETFGDVNAQDKTRGVASGVAQSATSTSIVLASSTNLPNTHPSNRVICITAGTGVGQCRLITAWVSSTDTATITGNWATTPSTDSEYFVYPASQTSIIALAEYLDDTADFPTLTEISDELGLLNDLSASAVNAEVDTALADYDGPTRAELTSDINGLNDLSAAQVNAEVDTAFADYDPPTRAELTSDINGLNDLNAAGVRSAVGLATANLDTQLGTIVADTNEVQGDLVNGGRIDVILDATLADTNELQADDIPAAIAALPTANDARDAVWQYAIDNGITAEEMMCYMVAVLVGTSDYDPNVPDAEFSDPTGTDLRVTATYGASAAAGTSSDRTGITLSNTNCGSN